MKRIFRDAINSALVKLGFPFLTPHPTKTGREIGYFQTTISDSDLYLMYKRNQIAHNVVFNVALDVFRPGFKCTTPEGKENNAFDAEVQKIYERYIRQPLFQGYLQARLYGSAGMLIGFDDFGRFDVAAESGSRISYTFAIPSNWIMGRVAETDANGYEIIPRELSYYELKYLRTGASKIDATRILHLQPASIEDNFEGESSLHCIFDVLTVLKNIDWSTGQAMFRHGAGLTTIVAGDGSSQAQLDAIDEVVTEINAKTVLTLPPGCKKETDRPGALDPKSYYDVIVAEIAGGSGIPVSILIGAQAGSVQASAKDRKDYGDLIAGIQLSDLEAPLKNILKLFQKSGQLPDDEFAIEWNDTSTFVIDAARGNLYNARAANEEAKVEEKRVQVKLLKCEEKQKVLEYKKQKREEEKEYEMQQQKPFDGKPPDRAANQQLANFGDDAIETPYLKKDSRHRRDKCMNCDKPPEYEVLWAEGMAHAWFCEDHLKKWLKESVARCAEEGFSNKNCELTSIKKLDNKEAFKKFSENKNGNILNSFLSQITIPEVNREKKKEIEEEMGTIKSIG